jgi:Iap family predicted aminopeptidase
MKSKMFWTLTIALIISMSLVAFTPIYGARPSSLTAEELAFAEAVGVGDYAYGINEIYAWQYGEFEWPEGSGKEAWRGAGSDAEHAYADYLVAEMTAIGLEDVAKEPFDVHAYHYGGASVQVVEPEEGDVWLACGYSGLPGTPPGGITAEIVYVGLGTKYDYEGKDVEGKLVLVDVSEEDMYWLQYPHYEAELHGAIGMVVTWVEYGLLEDSVVTHDSECRMTIPAVCISHKNADILKGLIAIEDSVEVKIWCDAEVDLDGTSYNVYGYIPGTIYPDEYVIIGDHYDKHWYGASDDGAGVATLLGVAKALVDSDYEPTRTLVFVATGAEEYGWSDTEFAWAIGAWWVIYDQHPEWIGKTLGYFNLEGGGTIGATSVYAQGTPETQGFRSRLLPLYDEWFSNNLPWSAYYYRSTEWTESFPSTWADEINFGTAGIPTMNFGSWRSDYAGYDYHTQKDDMYGISAESLAMTIIANGIAAIELDKSVLIPYSFEKRADDMKQYLEEELLTEAGINYRQIIRKVNAFRRVAADVTKLIKSTKNSENAEDVNYLLLQTADVLLSELLWVGGYIQPFYPHQHYQEDTWYLREGVWALEEGNIDAALMWLSWTFNMWTGSLVSHETYQAMYIDRWNPAREDLFWGTDRLAKVMDIYDEYHSLVQKKNDGITDYSAEIASLWATYDTAVDNYKASVNGMMDTLASATDLLNQVKALL